MKTKRVLSLALAISMALSLLILPANAASFTDVSGHWAEKLIEQAVAHGYVPAGGAFEPNKAITRNEFARMVNGAFGLTNAASISFSDVSVSDPYYKDVQKAVSAGYIAGYEDNTFRGTNLITRQEAAVIIARLVAYPNAALKTMNLKDTSSIGAWALPAAKIVFTKGYMVGDNLQKFNPKGNLTRAETVKILECILAGEDIISGNIPINAKNDTIIGKVYTGNLIISDSIGRSSVMLKNCKVLGTLLVNGGGETGVRLSNTGVANMTVDSQYQQPGVAAVGDSTVYNTYLKTTSQLVESDLSGMGAGFKNVTVGGTSAKVSLTGTTFDNVTINTPASLSLTSGKITNLTVGASAAGTSIKLDAGTNVANATLNAAAAISGKGTVTNKTGATAGTGTGTAVAGALAYTSTPAIGATKVTTASNISISFEDAIIPTNGQTLTTSWVRSNVVLRENTATGTTVDYSASISSNGKVLTIDPVAALKTGTEYMLTVNANAFKGQTNGKVNTSIAILFTTDGKSTSSSSSSTVISDDMTPEFYPGDETDNIPVDADLTLTFDEKIYDEDGKALTSSYLKKSVIELHKNDEDGTDVTFTATYNSTKKTITINPSSNLTKNTTYYLIVKEGTLTNSDDDSNDELVYSFTTAAKTDNVPLATPASGTQTMETDENFVFEFPTAVYDKNGDYLTESDIEGAFTIREGSKSGTEIDFEVEISSDDDTITLIPDGLLDSDEDYYVLLSKNKLTDEEGNYIPELTFTYFTGGKDVTINNNKKPVASGDLAPIETSPEHKETGVKRSDNIKLLFGEDIYTSAGKKITAANASALENCIEIRRGSQTGSKITFNATYDTNYGPKVVELDPKSNLSDGYTYYVIIKANTLTDADGNANDKFVFNFTVGSTDIEGLYVDVETDENSATLDIEYDYSEYDEDVDRATMTIKYRKEGASTWKTLTGYNETTLSSLLYGTKNPTISNLEEEETYEFEITIDLYDGLSYVDSDVYEDTFETEEDYYYSYSLIDYISVYDDYSEKWYDADDIVEVDDYEFEIELDTEISSSYYFGDYYVPIAIRATDDDVHKVYVDGERVYEDDGYYECDLLVDSDDSYVYVNISVVDTYGDYHYYTLYINLD